MKTIAFSAGGTLGHITPAISFINKLKQKLKCRIIFIATTKDEKYEVLSKNKNIDEIYYLDAKGRPRNKFKYLRVLFDNIKVLKEIRQILLNNKVDLLVGMGGYISGLSIYQAFKEHIKTVIHEQNSRVGFANKVSFKYVDKIFTSYESTIVNDKYKRKVIYIGNPRYDEVISCNNNFLDKYSLLVTSGSLGAKHINDVVIDMLNSYDFDKFTVTFITGKKYYDDVKRLLNKKINVVLKPFSNNLINDLNKSSIIISRAGSSTLFEILGLKKCAIVVPSPNVTENHQYFNAKEFSNQNLIKLLEEKNLNKDTLYEVIIEMINQYDIYQKRLEKFKIDSPTLKFINELVSLL